MTNPEISINRGVGWPNDLWEQAAPIVERAERRACEGIDYLELEFTIPKRGSIRRYASEDKIDFAGLSWAGQHFVVNTTMARNGRLHFVSRTADWSTISVHELVHTIRMEHFQYAGRLEKVAAEGLAYKGEHLFASEFWPNQKVIRLNDYSWRRNPALDRSFWEAYNSNSMSQWNAWFYADTKFDISRGALLGLQRVHWQMRLGRAYQELLTLPPEEVLGWAGRL